MDTDEIKRALRVWSEAVRIMSEILPFFENHFGCKQVVGARRCVFDAQTVRDLLEDEIRTMEEPHGPR
jgi:hypothetical protein